MYIKSSREIRLESRTIIKNDSGRVLLHALGFISLTYLLSLLYSQLSGYSEYVQRYVTMLQSGEEITVIDFPKVTTTAYILSILIYLMNIVIQGGYSGYCLIKARGHEANFRDIIPQAIFMLKIMAIDIFIGIAVVLGCIVFVVPGIILYYRYRLAIYVMYDHPEYSVLMCLKESGRLMKGNKMRLLKLDLSFFGWFLAAGVLAAMVAPVLDIWVQPYYGIASAVFYKDIATDGNYGGETM